MRYTKEFGTLTNALVLGTAKTGSIKFFEKPEILHVARNHAANMVILDEKGELLKNTKDELKAEGYKIDVLSLLNREKCLLRFNPFDDMKDETDILDFVKVFMDSISDGKEDDPYSSTAYENMWAIVITYIALFADKDTRTLYDMYDYLKDFIENPEGIFKKTAEACTNEFYTFIYINYMKIPAKMRMYVGEKALIECFFLRTEVVKQLHLAKEKNADPSDMSATFITYLHTKNMYYPIIRMFLALSMEKNYHAPIRTRYILKNLNQLGRINSLELVMEKSDRIDFDIITNSIDSKHEYLFKSMDNVICLGASTRKDVDFVMNISKKSMIASKDNSNIITPERIVNPGEDKCIVSMIGSKSFIAKKNRLSTWRNLSEVA